MSSGFPTTNDTNPRICVEAKRPSQHFFSPVGTVPPLPGCYQHFRGEKCLAQGHNTAEVGLENPDLPLRSPMLYH